MPCHHRHIANLAKETCREAVAKLGIPHEQKGAYHIQRVDSVSIITLLFISLYINEYLSNTFFYHRSFHPVFVSALQVFHDDLFAHYKVKTTAVNAM
jgi:hypothetical protein